MVNSRLSFVNSQPGAIMYKELLTYDYDRSLLTASKINNIHNPKYSGTGSRLLLFFIYPDPKESLMSS